MPDERRSAGDAVPQNCQLIEVRVGELKQLFNAMDPSPFRERDLDPNAEAFIVGWAREMPADALLGLMVHLERPAGMPHEAELLGEAIREYFSHRSQATRQQLRQLFRVGRTSLVIGVICLTASIALSDLVARVLAETRLGELLRESLLIGGWVAMWRPLEIFLYDWWPIRDEGRLFDRLSKMVVRIEYSTEVGPDKWRSDWPAVSPGLGRLTHEPLAYVPDDRGPPPNQATSPRR
jgi:hypothetical protein